MLGNKNDALNIIAWTIMPHTKSNSTQNKNKQQIYFDLHFSHNTIIFRL